MVGSALLCLVPYLLIDIEGKVSGTREALGSQWETVLVEHMDVSGSPGQQPRSRTDMSSTIPLPPREQLSNRYCSNKHTLPDVLSLFRSKGIPQQSVLVLSSGWTLPFSSRKYRGFPSA